MVEEQARSIEILLVEDNTDDVTLVLDALKESVPFNNIQVVRDGAEALDFIFRRGAYTQRQNHRPKLILLDLKLPRLSGLEVLQEIRADPHTRPIPVVMLTASREERDIFESYNLGANSYIVKAVDFEQFTSAMQQISMYWLRLNQLPDK